MDQVKGSNQILDTREVMREGPAHAVDFIDEVGV